MMAKRILYILLVTVLVFGIMLTSCDSKQKTNEKALNSTPDGPVRIKFWVWDNVNNSQSRNVEMFNNTHDNIKVDIEVVSWDNYHDKLMASLSGGNGPDVCNMQVTWIPEFVDMDALVQLDDLLKEWPDRDDIYENIWAATRGGTAGKTFAIPTSANVYYMYCRKDLFQAAGASLPETVDQFYDACKKLTMDTNGDGKIDVHAFGMQGARMGHAMWMGITFSDGPNKMVFFDKAGNVALDNPQLIKANQRYIDLYKNKYTPRTAPKDGANEIQQSFLAGATAMLVHHMGSAKLMNDKFGDRLAVIPIPKGQAGRFVPMEMVVNGILKTSEHQEEALEFMKWWTSTDSHDFICQNMGQTPVLKSVSRLPFYQQDRFARISMDSLPDAYLIPPTPEMGQWTEEIWPQEFQKVLLGQSSSEQFIKNIADMLKAIK